jgi:hypothetical protein
MAAPKKTTYINTELDWAEEQLSSWKQYVDANPMHELGYRLVKGDHITGTKNHYLYCHFLTDSNMPFYVGIGTNSKLKSYNRSKSKTGRNKIWQSVAREKYIILICQESDNYEEIKEFEKESIELYGFENLTNLTLGGNGCIGYKHSIEHIEKLKLNYKLGKCVLQNRKVSDLEKKLKSLKYSGSGNPNYGKSGHLSNIGKVVIKLDFEKKVIAEYGSLRSASEQEEVSHTSMRKAIIKNTKCKGFYWKYK